MSIHHPPYHSHPGHQVYVANAYKDCPYTASLMLRLPLLSPTWLITLNIMLADKRRRRRKEEGGASSLLSPLPLQRGQLQNTYWKAVTNFSHIGLVSVLNQKTILCVSFPVPLFLIKTGWACIPKPSKN